MSQESTKPSVLNDRYEIKSLIGRGGMADVFLAHDELLGREVAVKLLRRETASDPMVLSRFRREAKAVAGLNHHSIVQVYDTGEQKRLDEGNQEFKVPFIVMEYVKGRTLRDLLKSGEITVPLAVTYTRGVLSALEFSHAHGIVHRDIKPANVMLTESGNVKVMDFGIARALSDASATMTQTQAIVGTAQYLSPEQARGEAIDLRSDIYSAGCLLFELATGRPPFVGESPVAVAYQHVGEKPVDASSVNTDVSPALDAVINKALEKDPADRFESASQFDAALEAVESGLPLQEVLILIGEKPSDCDEPTVPTDADATAALATTTTDDPTSTYASVDPSLAGVTVGAGALGAGSATALSGDTGGAVGFAAADDFSAVNPNDADSDGSFLGDYMDQDEEAGSERERRSPNRGPWIAVFTLLALALLAGGAYFFLQWTQQQQQANATVPVPAVAGMTQIDAQNTLITAGFRPRTEERFSDEVPRGNVIGTEPTAGTNARQNADILMLLSKGPENLTLPKDLEGQSESTVRDRLGKLNLTVDDQVEHVNSASIPSGMLVKTNPALGEQVRAGTTISITLSTGRVDVPRVIDMTDEEAKKLLEGDEYRLNVQINYVSRSGVTPGTVVAQLPHEGEAVGQGGIVTIDVARAPVPIPTPATKTVTASPTPSSSAPTSSAPSTSASNSSSASSSAPSSASTSPTPTPTKDPGDNQQ